MSRPTRPEGWIKEQYGEDAEGLVCFALSEAEPNVLFEAIKKGLVLQTTEGEEVGWEAMTQEEQKELKKVCIEYLMDGLPDHLIHGL